MIVFDLHCEHSHRFEGWFKSSSDYEDQTARGFLVCPECGTSAISKAPMAPAVPAKTNTRPDRVPERVPARMPQKLPETVQTDASNQGHSKGRGEGQGETQSISNTAPPVEVQKVMEALAKAQAKALENSTFVGKDFAKQSREMHYGERDAEIIHGQASLEEAKALVDEGVAVAPLPFPVAPPEKLN